MVLSVLVFSFHLKFASLVDPIIMQNTHLFTLFFFAVLLGVSSFAQASHYYLVDIPSEFSESDRELLARFGIDDTEDLLRWIDTPDMRNALQSMSGLSADRINALTVFCDLLQIDGVGPSAARLLMATNITGTADLVSRDEGELLAEIQYTNQIETITPTTPSDGHLHMWVLSAIEVPITVIY